MIHDPGLLGEGFGAIALSALGVYVPVRAVLRAAAGAPVAAWRKARVLVRGARARWQMGVSRPALPARDQVGLASARDEAVWHATVRWHDSRIAERRGAAAEAAHRAELEARGAE